MFTSPTQAQTHTRIWTSQRGERSENAGGILRPDSFFYYFYLFSYSVLILGLWLIRRKRRIQ